MGVATGGEWKSQYGRHKTGMIGVGWLLNDDGKKMNRNTVKGILDVLFMFASFWGMNIFCALAEDSDTKFSFLTFELLQLVQMCFVVFFDFWLLGFARILLHPKIALWPTKKPGKKKRKRQLKWVYAKGAKKSGKVSEGNNLTPKTSVFFCVKKRCVFFIWCWTWRMEWDFSSKWL